MTYGKYTVTLSNTRKWAVIERNTLSVVMLYAYGSAGFKSATELRDTLNTNATFEVK